MINKSDWEAAFQELDTAESVGAPPGDEELLAFSRGELPEDETARVREFLSHHPELARALTEPFPAPGDTGLVDLTEEEMAQGWAALQAKLATKQSIVPEPVRASVVPADESPHHFRGWLLGLVAPGPGQLRFAISAALALVLGGLYVQAQLNIRQLQEPRALAHRILEPDGRRGSGEQPPIELREHTDFFFVLTPRLAGTRDFPEYRLDILSLNGRVPEQIWSSSELHLQPDGSLGIGVPREFLKPGEYRLELFGLAEGRLEPLLTYTVRRPTN